MKHLMTAFSICLLISPLSAKATTFLESLQIAPTVEDSRGEQDKCTNFSGTWKGTCKAGEGSSKEETFTVKQKGCEMIDVTHEKHHAILPVGGVFGVKGAVPGKVGTVFGGDLCSSWNKEMNVLNINISGGKKQLTLNDAGEGIYIMETMKMVGDKKMGVEVNVYEGEKKKTTHCEFDKQD